MSVGPMPQNDQMVTNGFCSFRWVRWFDELVNGHVGDATTLDGVPASGYAPVAHVHTTLYAPVGAWVDEAFDGGNFTGGWTVAAGNQITLAYTVNGKVLTVLWQIDAATTTGSAALLLRIPGLYTANLGVTGTHAYQTTAGGWDVGAVEATVSGTTLAIYTRTRAAWPAEAGTVYTRGQMTLEIA